MSSNFSTKPVGCRIRFLPSGPFSPQGSASYHLLRENPCKTNANFLRFCKTPDPLFLQKTKLLPLFARHTFLGKIPLPMKMPCQICGLAYSRKKFVFVALFVNPKQRKYKTGPTCQPRTSVVPVMSSLAVKPSPGSTGYWNLGGYVKPSPGSTGCWKQIVMNRPPRTPKQFLPLQLCPEMCPQVLRNWVLFCTPISSPEEHLIHR